MIDWPEDVAAAVRSLVFDELKPTTTTQEPTITVRVVERIACLGPTSRSLGPVDFVDGAVRFRLPVNGLTLGLRADAPDECVVHLGQFETKYGLPKSLYRIANPTAMSTTQAQAYAFVVSVIEPMLLMVGRRTALTHAAALERNGSGVLLTSAGGVGKTTTSMALLRQPGWSFLSDDIALLDSCRGRIRLHPRHSMVYQYNVNGDPALRSSVADRSLLSRVHWAAMSKLPVPQPRRRVAAATLFGADSVASEALIDTVAFLVRGPSGVEPVADPLSRAELVRRSGSILETEFDRHLTLLRLWDATGTSWLSPGDVMERQRRLLARAVERAEVWQVTVPTAGTPEATAQLIAGLSGNG